ncbi:MAG: hypothetical protein GWP14_10705 [Actinobacteria bacterium]|nr:hypothetical protein [Actinomycetota bacterium]
MINPEALRKRKWPVPSFPIGHEVAQPGEADTVAFCGDAGEIVLGPKEAGYVNLPFPPDYLESCYAREEMFTALPLPFPPGESGINALAKDKQGNVFGLCSGVKSHLFIYNSKDGPEPGVTHLGTLEGAAQKGSLVVTADNRLFFGLNTASGDGYLYAYDSNDSTTRLKKICCPVKGEAIAALIADESSPRIYGLSGNSGTFFVLDLDKDSLEWKGPVDKDGLFSRTLTITASGDVFGGCRWTKMFKYDREKDRLVFMDINAPIISGRQMYNRLESLVYDEQTDSIYGGTSADGILFRFMVNQDKLISIGKPLNQPHIRCLTVGADNCIYGMAGKHCCHLFRYDPAEGDLRDLGIIHVRSPRPWHCYECDAAVTGNDGRIYLGQNERVSYLFVYSPSVC